MSGRTRGPPHSMKGVPHAGLPPSVHEPPYARGLPSMPHPALLDEMREFQLGRGPPGPIPHHHRHAMIEEHLTVQHQEIQALLDDNQRLATTHVALKQELELAHHDIKRMSHVLASFQAEKDTQLRELYEKSVKMDANLRGVDAMKAELSQVHADIKKLDADRKELMGQVQGITQDLARANTELQRAPALRAEIEGMTQELQRARAAIEYERKGYQEHYEHGKEMEKNLISMARELEKLRAEIANSEKRALAAAAVGNQAYAGHYPAPEAPYAANPYPVNYGMNPMQPGPEGYPQYVSGPGQWGGYDMQRPQGQR
uniref:Protein FLX-like 1 n=1 Tax=Kalanchoe fedtschenkoi TaxID=63787 RepID=A0A7N1A7J5_KALFE